MRRTIDDLKKEVLPLFVEHNVVKASVFGSFVRGEEKQDSDIDFLVEFKGVKSLLDLAALKIALEEKLRRKVDLLTYKSLHPLLREKILKEQKSIL